MLRLISSLLGRTMMLALSSSMTDKSLPVFIFVVLVMSEIELCADVPRSFCQSDGKNVNSVPRNSSEVCISEGKTMVVSREPQNLSSNAARANYAAVIGNEFYLFTSRSTIDDESVSVCSYDCTIVGCYDYICFINSLWLYHSSSLRILNSYCSCWVTILRQLHMKQKFLQQLF